MRRSVQGSTFTALVALFVALVAQAPAGAQARATTFVARRPGLAVKLIVRGHRIVYTSTSSRVHCEGGTVEGGSASSGGWSGFGIGPTGRFSKAELEADEGSGEYFWRLRGRVRANRAVGDYTAWEERLGGEDEGWLPRCGTRSPRGLPIRFVARRVAGPPWRR